MCNRWRARAHTHTYDSSYGFGKINSSDQLVESQIRYFMGSKCFDLLFEKRKIQFLNRIATNLKNLADEEIENSL